MPRFSTGLWRSADFMRLWIGQTISEFGSRITRDGLILTAVLVLSASPSQLGMLSAAASLPVLVFGLFAGVWIDRLHRRPILLAVDTARMLILLTIPLAWLAGVLRIELLYGVAALMGICTLVFESAYRAFLPSLVAGDQLVDANSRLATTDALAEIGGPALAGVLIQLLGVPLAILLDALSYLASIFSVAGIRTSEPAREPIPLRSIPAPLTLRHRIASVLDDVLDGLRVIALQPTLRVLVSGMAVRSFFGHFFAVLYSYYVITVLGLSPAALGIIISTGGIGALFGALIAARLPRRYGIGRVLIGALSIGACANLLIPAADGTIWLKLALLITSQIVGDAAMTVYAISELSLRQQIIPNHLLGRANASIGFLAEGVGPLGALVAGGAAVAFGARAALWMAAVGILATAAALLFSRVGRQTAFEYIEPG